MPATKPDSKLPDAFAKSFGARVAVLRERAGLSFAEFAEPMGTSKGYLWKVEKGETVPTLRNAARMARVLGVTLSELVEDVDISGMELGSRPYRGQGTRKD
ncbi:helix-turn-helix domain-containing protein [Erythrobacter sp. 3-20A1M]|uniref:helix-turn-helix domain-containing protein n=1 Tax=Erythrobacter sp. 3-20A1M TaxID=2653850 RepID=UPI001BFC70E7|nr:helix-turn-helix transcriptional regulator [Erythrobacter sp. 3-20A1M]QWC57495.1 helix-turn-helix domain-containing protein [Erythrobacter sp. 3-20A1M]